MAPNFPSPKYNIEGKFEAVKVPLKHKKVQFSFIKLQGRGDSSLVLGAFKNMDIVSWKFKDGVIALICLLVCVSTALIFSGIVYFMLCCFLYEFYCCFFALHSFFLCHGFTARFLMR